MDTILWSTCCTDWWLNFLLSRENCGSWVLEGKCPCSTAMGNPRDKSRTGCMALCLLTVHMVWFQNDSCGSILWFGFHGKWRYVRWSLHLQSFQSRSEKNGISTSSLCFQPTSVNQKTEAGALSCCIKYCKTSRQPNHIQPAAFKVILEALFTFAMGWEDYLIMRAFIRIIRIYKTVEQNWD